jgi:hypothetical protein
MIYLPNPQDLLNKRRLSMHHNCVERTAIPSTRVNQMKPPLHFVILIVLAISILMILVPGCGRQASQKPVFKTEYQAVFLANGQVYFGKIENTDSSYPLLRDVYYIQRQVGKDPKDIQAILVKRVNDWHAPDYMYINASQIALIEPVSPNSKVAQLIKEAKGK